MRELQGKVLRPVLQYDLEMSLAGLNPEMVEGIFYDLDRLEPTGINNPGALFISRNLKRG